MTKFSFSRLASGAHCLRQYELRYVEGLEKKQGVENEGRILGSAIHAGFEYTLRHMFTHDNQLDVQGATRTAKAYVEGAADKYIVDQDYLDMIESVRWEAAEFLEYYLPRIGLGNRYVPVSVKDVLPALNVPDIAFVEYDFELPLFGDHVLVGRIDAVLRDLETGELVLTDWKSRISFPKDWLASIDDQLHLYAAVINNQGGSIERVMMAQMKRGLPKGAEMSAKDGLPLTGRASYNATWDSFVQSLPAGLDPEPYRAKLEGKLKQHEPDFWHPVTGFVTQLSSMLVLENIAMQVNALTTAAQLDEYPARMSYSACQFCEFSPLCASPFRYGGNAAEQLATDYQKRDRSEVVPEAMEAVE